MNAVGSFVKTSRKSQSVLVGSLCLFLPVRVLIGKDSTNVVFCVRLTTHGQGANSGMHSQQGDPAFIRTILSKNNIKQDQYHKYIDEARQ